MCHRLCIALISLLCVAALSCTHAVRPETMPVRDAPLPPCPASPNCVSSEATDSEHYVEPLRVAGDPIQAMQQLKHIVETLPRTRIVTATDAALHAECTSLIFRFVDDLDLRFDPRAGVMQVRSASRTGYSDLGVNRRRVEAIRRAFTSQPATRTSQ